MPVMTSLGSSTRRGLGGIFSYESSRVFLFRIPALLLVSGFLFWIVPGNFLESRFKWLLKLRIIDEHSLRRG